MPLLDAQRQIRIVAANTVRGLWREVPTSATPEVLTGVLLDEIPPIIDTFSDVAATVAADHFETVVGLPAVLADPPPVEAVRSSVTWATQPITTAATDTAKAAELKRTLERMLSMVDRNTLAAADRTTRLSAQRNAVRWAWVPAGKTCGFCTLKASRGPVYHYEDAAEASLSGRHAHCDCRAEPVASDDDLRRLITDGGYDLDGAQRVYREARSAAGTSDVNRLVSEINRLQGRP